MGHRHAFTAPATSSGMDKRDPATKSVDYAIDPDADDVVDLTSREGPHDLGVRLKCSGCPPADRVSNDGSEDFDEVPARTKPVRKSGDPDTVVRCARCGKRHSTNSLTVE